MGLALVVAALANPYAAGPLSGPAERPHDVPVLTVSEADPFSWDVPKLVADGVVEIALRIPAGFAVYRDAITIEASPGPVSLGEIPWPDARLAVDPSDPERWRSLYEGDVVLRIPVRGTGDLALTVSHQGCRKGLCWPPSTSEHTVRVVASSP